jgi:hypothetical protein
MQKSQHIRAYHKLIAAIKRARLAAGRAPRPAGGVRQLASVRPGGRAVTGMIGPNLLRRAGPERATDTGSCWTNDPTALAAPVDGLTVNSWVCEKPNKVPSVGRNLAPTIPVPMFPTTVPWPVAVFTVRRLPAESVAYTGPRRTG